MSNKENATKIVNNHVLWSMGGGLIPIPLADIVAVTALQTGMLEQLSVLYDVKYNGSMAKTFVTGLSGSAVASLGASLLKIVPGVGTVLGGVAMSIASGASTYAVGKIAVKHFEAGGNWNNLNIEQAKADYSEAFEEGKEVAAKQKKENETTA
ncbi:MAG: DUF697 domain-containing protein [Chloroflexi bacterium]|nr:DUF697 domain-containing protein [Chloroflexota bacterium]